MKRKIIVFVLIVECFFLFPCENEIKQITLSIGMPLNYVYELLGKPEKTILSLDTVNDDYDIYRDIYDGLAIHYFLGIKDIYELYVYDSKYKILINNQELRIGENRQQVEEKFGEGNFFYKDKYNQYIFRYWLPPIFFDDMFLECYYDYAFKLCGIFIGAQSDYVGLNWTRYEQIFSKTTTVH